MSVMIINETHCQKIFVNRYFEAFHNIVIIFEKRLNKGITITTVKGSISTVCDYTSLYLVFSIPSKSSSYCCMSLLSQLNRIQKHFLLLNKHLTVHRMGCFILIKKNNYDLHA